MGWGEGGRELGRKGLLSAPKMHVLAVGFIFC